MHYYLRLLVHSEHQTDRQKAKHMSPLWKFLLLVSITVVLLVGPPRDSHLRDGRKEQGLIQTNSSQWRVTADKNKANPIEHQRLSLLFVVPHMATAHWDCCPASCGVYTGQGHGDAVHLQCAGISFHPLSHVAPGMHTGEPQVCIATRPPARDHSHTATPDLLSELIVWPDWRPAWVAVL